MVAEMPDTVDDALEALSSPSTLEVELGTRAFSSRELASSAARRAMAGGGGDGDTPDIAAVLTEGHDADGKNIINLGHDARSTDRIPLADEYQAIHLANSPDGSNVFATLADVVPAPFVGPDPPDDPTEGMLWFDTDDDTPADSSPNPSYGARSAQDITGGAVDATDTSYILIGGGGDDTLTTIIGGVDGKAVLLESDGTPITISDGDFRFVSPDITHIVLGGETVHQALAVYSDFDGNWTVWGISRMDTISSDTNQSAVGANDTTGVILGTNKAIQFSATADPTSYLINSNFAPQLDDTPGATKLKFWAKDSGGTLRSVTLDLA